MVRRWMGTVAGLLLVAACAAASEDGTAAAPQPAGPCAPVDRMPLAGRASPYDSATVAVGGGEIKVCYGRPAARGRTIFGELVPFDTLWRSGANEPTIVHVSVPVEVAGIRLDPGSYSLYTVPGREQWSVILNRSTSQWGHESQYTAPVRAQEIARATVPAGRTDAFQESFLIRAETAGQDAANLVLEWENTRVVIPVRAT